MTDLQITSQKNEDQILSPGTLNPMSLYSRMFYFDTSLVVKIVFSLFFFLIFSFVIFPSSAEAATITISGTLYSDEGTTAITSGKTIKVAVGTSTVSVYSTTSNGSGVWSITGVPDTYLNSTTTVLAWVDGDGSTRAARFTIASSTGNIPNLNLYQDHVIISHEATNGSKTVANTDLAFYDYTNDTDIQYDASSTISTLRVLPGNELYIAPNKTFAPGGTVTLSGNGDTAPDGDLKITSGATLNNTSTFTLAGNYRASSTATINNYGTLVFNATTTGKTLGGTMDTASTSLGSVTFNGSGGAWTFLDNATTSSFIITNGSVTAPTDLTVTGDLYNNGTFNAPTNLYLEGEVGYSLDGASYTDVFYIGTEETTPTGIAFNNDGTKLYVVGAVGDDINEYALSVPYDVSTGSYTDLFSVAAQDTSPTDLAFNLDGTKLYVIGATGQDINEYALSVPWDVSTGSYTDNFSVASEETLVEDLAFNKDGTKLYVIGRTGDDVNEYALSVSWDVSTASYTDNFSVASEETSPTGLAFNNDGSELYIIGLDSDTVSKYTLSVPWDVSTGILVDSFDTSIQEISATDIAFNPDGTKLYVIGISGDDVNEYAIVSDHEQFIKGNLTTTNDLNNLYSNNSNYTLISANASTTDLSIATGTLYATGKLSLTGDLNVTGTYKNAFKGNLGTTTFNGGTTQNITGSGGLTFNDLTVTSGTTLVAPAEMTVSGTYQNNGTFTAGSGEVVLGAAYDLDYASYTDLFSVSAQETSPFGLAFNPDGTKLYVVGPITDNVYEYALSAPWDVSTASYTDNFSVASEETTPTGLAFNNDGTKLYVIGASGDDINEYALSTPWDVSTGVYTDLFSVSAQESSPHDLAFNNDGTKLYVLGDTGNDINEYALSVPWDVSTGSYTDNFSVGAQEIIPYGFAFKPDGTKLYVVGTVGDDVNEYALSVPWDVSTASYTDLFSVKIQEDGSSGLAFNNDGTKLYVIGQVGDDINEYTLGSPTTLQGNLTNTSAFNDVTVNAATFLNNASTSDLTVNGTLVAPDSLSISGNYQNNGTVDFGTGTTTFNGNALQTATGTLDGTSAFNNVVITNTSGTNADSAPSIIFGNTASSSGTLSITDPGVMVQFLANATTTWQNLELAGDAGDYVYLRSTTGGTQWGLLVPGTRSVDYVNVKDSTACSPYGDISNAGGFDAGNNNCWTFSVAPIFFSGTLFSDEGTTPITSGKTIKAAVGTSTVSVYSVTSDGSGDWSVSLPLTYINATTTILAWVDGDSVKAARFTIASSTGNIPNLNLYQDHVILSHEATDGSKTVTNTDLAFYDYTNDTDIQYDVTSGALKVLPGQELYIAPNKTFAPGGTVTLSGNGDTAPDGDLKITSGATLNNTGTFTLAGNYRASSTATINNTGTLVFNATTTGKTLGGTMDTASTSLGSVNFNGSGGAWTFLDNATTSSFIINNGTVTAPTDLTVTGDLYNDGAFTAPTNLYLEGEVGYSLSDVVYTDLFSVAAQETNPTGLAFNNDGTKLYVIGSAGDDINEYALSIPYDVSTGVYTDLFSISAQEAIPQDLAFNNDGTKLYVIGSSGDDINEYALSVPWDVSTGVYTDLFSVAAQETGPTGLAFNNDGTKLYVIGSTGDDINEYTLSVPWDVSTGVYTDLFSVAAQEGSPQGLAFNPNGTKLYVIGDGSDKIYEYALSVLWDVSTAVYTDLFSVTAQETTPSGLVFNNDGTKLYVLGDTGNDINEYGISGTSGQGMGGNFTAANDLNNLYTNNDKYTIISGTASTSDLSIATGTVFSTGKLSLTGDLNVTGTYKNAFKGNLGTTTFNGGTTQNITGTGASTFNDLTITSGTTLVAPAEMTVSGAYQNNGTFTGGSGEIALGAAYDFDYASYIDLFSVAIQDDVPQNLAFNPDGTKLYVIGLVGQDINEYALSVPWDVSTAVYTDLFSVAAQETAPQGLAFNPDGTKLYVTGSTGDDINEYALSVPWDVSTGVYTDLFSVAAQETSPTSLAFNSDGTKLYVLGDAGNDINEYILSVPYDVSTGSFTDNFSVTAQEGNPRGLAFNPDGTKIFMTGDASDNIYEYILSVPWDVSTGVYTDLFSVAAQEISPTGLAFNPDGTKLYVIGYAGDNVYEYTFGKESTLSGSLTNTSAFNDVTVNAATFLNNASTSDLTVNGTMTAPDSLSITGNYQNNGTVDFGTGTTTFNGSTLQTATGTLDGTSAFNNVVITNTSGTNADSAPSIIFGATASSSGTLSITDPGVMVQFLANATTTWQNLELAGDAGDYVYLRSTTGGTQWGLLVPGTRSVDYVNVKDSSACSPYGDIANTNSFDAGNNNCWIFPLLELLLSGTLFSDEGTTEITSGKTIKVAVGTSTVSVYSTTTNSGTGDWVVTLPSDYINATTTILAWVDGDGSTRAARFTIASTSGTSIYINNLNLYQDHVILSHEATDGSKTVTNTDLAFYDYTNDTDIQYDVTSGALKVLPGQELYIAPNKTFAPGGTVTLSGNGDTAPDGDLKITSGATLNNTSTFTLAGNYRASSTATINNTGTLVFNATTTGKTLGGTMDTASTSLGSVNFNGSGGAWTFLDNATTSSFIINNGTVTAPTDLTVTGDLYNNGSFTAPTNLYLEGEVGYSLNNVSYTDSFSVSAQETAPQDIAFNPDGTKLYVVGATTNDAVYEYALSTPYDVSTGSYTDLFSVAAQETSPSGLAFNPDGTKLYVLGDTGDDVNEYALSVPWDVSTAVYTDLFSVSAQETTPNGLDFNKDGTKLYVIGSTGDDINEYTLSVPWDVSTGSFTDLFSVAEQETFSNSLAFNLDGTKLYVSGSNFDSIYEYILKVPWDVSSSIHTNSFYIGTDDIAPQGLALSPIGTKLYVVGLSGQDINEYAISGTTGQGMGGDFTEANDLNNLYTNNDNYTIISGTASTTDLSIATGTVHSIGKLSLAGDLNATGIYKNTFKVNAGYGTTTFNGGTTQTISGSGVPIFNDLTITSGTTLVAPAEMTVSGAYTNNGTFTAGSGEVTAGAAYDFNYASYTDLFSVAAQEADPRGLAFNSDGTKLYVVGLTTSDSVYEYALSVPYDVSTGSYTDLFSVAAQDTTPTDLAFNPDGTKLYVVGATNDSVYEYALSVPWDVSTGAYTDLFSVAAQEATPSDLAFNPDGTKLYVSGTTGDDINEYALSVPWDVSTGVYTDLFSVAVQETNPSGLAFNFDGTKLFVIGSTGDDINEYALSVPWDVSTGSYTDLFSVAVQDTVPQDIVFNSAGTKLYVVGSSGDNVYEYSLSPNTDIAGNLTNTSAFNDVTVNAATFLNNASTSDLTVSGTMTAPDSLSISGDYTNNGTVDFGTGTTTFNGSALQTATGTLDGTSAFNNVVITNTSGTNADSAPSIIFGATASSSGTLSITDPGVMVQFLANATTTWQNLELAGDSGDYVYLRSTTGGTQWGLLVPGTRSVDYVNVKDSTACSPYGDISTTNSVSSAANNNCWVLSLLQLLLSGTLFSDEGTTPITSGKTIKLAIGTSTVSTHTTTSDGSGDWSFDTLPNNISSTTPILAWVDGDSVKAAAFTIASTSGTSIYINNLNLYQDHVILSHEATDGSKTVANTDLAFYDYTNDTDIQYDVTSGALKVLPGQELYIAPNKTFAPGGTVTLSGNGDTAPDGDLKITSGATLNNTSTFTLAGNYRASSTATINNYGTLVFNATTTGKTLGGTMDTASTSLGSVTFNGSGGAWTFLDNATTSSFIITNGSVTAPTDLTVTGDLYNDGSFTAPTNLYLSDASVSYSLNNVSYTDLFSVSAQDTDPKGLAFNPDGTKLYVVGAIGDDINEYALSTPYDVSTGSYTDLFSVAAEDTTPQDLTFNPEGTKLYVLGDAGNDINEYALSVPWDVSTGSYTDLFSVAGQETTPTGMAFSLDGTKLYVVGESNDTVYEYSLSVPWDVSTGMYTDNFSVVAQDINPNGITFNNSGTKLYIVGWTGDSVYEYILSVPWDVSTAIYTDVFSVVTQETGPTGLAFNNTGTKLYVIGQSGDDINEYAISGTAGQGMGGDFTDSNDLNNLYSNNDNYTIISGTASTTNLSIATSTLSSIGKLSLAGDLNATGVYKNYFKGNFGTTTFNGGTTQTITGSGVPSFNDLTITSGTTLVAPADMTVTGSYQNNGTFTHSSGEVTLGVAYDFEYASYTDLFSVAAEETGPGDVSFNSDGTKLYVIGSTGDDINEYALSVPWDVSTASYTDLFSVAAEETAPTGLAFNPDGTKLYVIGQIGDSVYEYALSVPWDVSTASYTDLFSVAAQEDTPSGLAFNLNGTKLYVIGSTGDDINEYALSVPWDVSTGIYTDLFSVSAQETSPQGLAFNPGGTKLYVIGSTGDDINEYALSVPWDVSTGVYTDLFSVAAQETNPTGLTFKQDGIKLYVVGSTGDDINEYIFGASATLSGSLTNTSALNDVTVNSATFTDNASTSDLTISATMTAPDSLSISGDYQNNGTVDFGTGTTTFNGTALQTATGTLDGTSAFNNVVITNTSGTNADSAPSIIFGATASSSGTLSITDPGVMVQFLAGATTTWQNLQLAGDSGDYVYLRSTTGGTEWGLLVPGTRSVDYVNVKDSSACSPYGDISTTNSISSAANNDCWSGLGLPVGSTITSATNQVFSVGQATTSMAAITITPGTDIAAVNDIRITIATTSVDMLWDTTDTTASYTGTGTAKVSTSVSYENGGATLVIPVDSDFTTEDTLVISGLSFAQFGSLNTATTALALYLDGVGDTVANNTDSATVTIVGGLAVSDHDGGQVASTFAYQNKVGTALFGFNLEPLGESSTIATLVFSVSGVKNIDTNKVSNLALYRDMDDDGELSAGDIAIGGSGVLSITGQSGTITFSTPFSATTTQNYLLVGDTTGIKPIDKMTLNLNVSGGVTGDVSSATITPTGSVSSVQHLRAGGGGAGGGNSGFVAEIGGDAPDGDGDIGGGSGDAGESIGGEPGFQMPTVSGSLHNEWTNGAEAFDSDGVYATAASTNLRQSYSVFGFNVPGGSVVNGIEVKLEASGSTAAGTIEVGLSWNGDSTITAVKSTSVLTGTDVVYTLGGPADTWGRSWTPTELGNANFFVRVIGQPDGNTVRIDAMQVRPYHSVGGGGGGGGEEI